jgi:hypothetical protein
MTRWGTGAEVEDIDGDTARTVWHGVPPLLRSPWWRKWAMFLVIVTCLLMALKLIVQFGPYASWAVLPFLAAGSWLLFGATRHFDFIRLGCVLRARKPGQRALIKGQVRGICARSNHERAAVLSRTKIISRPSGAQAKRLVAYVQEACDFDLVTEDGRAVRVRAAGAQLLLSEPEVRGPFTCMEVAPAVIEKICAHVAPVLGESPAQVESVCRQSLCEGAWVEVFGTLRAAALATTQHEVLPHEEPPGQELALAPAGLYIIPWSPLREEWLLVPQA